MNEIFKNKYLHDRLNTIFGICNFNKVQRKLMIEVLDYIMKHPIHPHTHPHPDDFVDYSKHPHRVNVFEKIKPLESSSNLDDIISTINEILYALKGYDPRHNDDHVPYYPYKYHLPHWPNDPFELDNVKI